MESSVRSRAVGFACSISASLAVASAAGAFTIDFESDDGGNPLNNGQAICTGPLGCVIGGETVFEYGNLVDVSTTAVGPGSHMGAAIFDSTPGTNVLDPDLWVGKDNILILQNDSHPTTVLDGTFGRVFTSPNDEKDPEDAGSMIFDFNTPVTLFSVAVIDINGGVELAVILTDGSNLSRTYSVPEMWTQDVSACGGLGPGCLGYHTLLLDTLADQSPEPNATGSDATASQDLGFDPTDVRSLEVAFMSATGTSPISGGIDDIMGVPEPATAPLAGLGLLVLSGYAAQRRRRRTTRT